LASLASVASLTNSSEEEDVALMMQATFHDKNGHQTPNKSYMMKTTISGISEGTVSDFATPRNQGNKAIPDHERRPPPRAILGGGMGISNERVELPNGVQVFVGKEEKALSGLYEKSPM
jgi:hypothetical protein